MTHTIGIDVGGTGLKAGVVDERGVILSKVTCPTEPLRGYEAVIADIAALAVQAAHAAGDDIDQIQSIGIGIPGIHDPVRNVVPRCVNLFWTDVPLIAEMQKHLRLPIFVDNDANVAGLAEAIAGASKGVSSSVLITLGTGIGSAIIRDGRIDSGSHGCGGEIGHMIIRAGGILCTCGHRGCWERYANAGALIRMGTQIANEHPDGAIARAAAGVESNITARTVIDCAKAGDPDALAAFDQYVEDLCIGLSNVLMVLDPEMIVLGGGVAGAGAFLLDKVREIFPRYAVYPNIRLPRIELAVTGNDAGIIGAAFLGR